MSDGDTYQPAPPEKLAPVPDDTGDMRGAHLRHLLGNPITLIITVVLAVIVLVAIGSSSVGFGGGAIGAGVVILLALIVVFVIANNQSREDFYNAYSKGRSLTRIAGRSSIPPLTPLLQKGDERYADQRFNGVLPGGIDGSLVLYTYEEETRDSDGNKQTTYIHYTLVMSELPATAPYLQELFCQRRVGFRFMDGMEDVFRKRQRVEQESAAVDKAYEIFIGEHDDMVRARQVLSPSFLVWLDQNSPDAYAFELCGGALVCNVKGHKKSSAELDKLCQASAAVARRLNEQASSVIQQPTPPGSPNPTPPASA